MKYSELKQVLKNHKLRVTDSRMDILEFFTTQNHALTVRDLEDHFHDYDRVTLYRTLASFSEKGVLHKIPDDSGLVTYGLCYDTCSSDEHHHNHVHFKCIECGNIECINVSIPKVTIPGYQVLEANYIVNGICKNCA